MLRFVVLSALLALGYCGIISTSYGGDSGGSDHGLGGLDLASLSLSGASHGLGGGGLGSEGHSLELGGGGLSDWSSGGAGGGSGGNSGGGDFHHGVSIVGGGGSQQGQTIDLTHKGDIHHGLFGGSFVASSKYSGHGGGGSDGGLGGHGYGVAEGGGFEGHYSDVLGAGDDHSSGGYESLSSGSFGHDLH